MYLGLFQNQDGQDGVTDAKWPRLSQSTDLMPTSQRYHSKKKSAKSAIIGSVAQP